MLFTWEYLLILIAVVALYYSYFKKFPFAFLSIVSLIIISFWSITSVVAVTILTAFTALITKANNKTITYFGIGINIAAILSLKSELSWIGNTSHISQWGFLGLSYFGLQNISYLLAQKKEKHIQAFILHNLLFSKFIAGPISEYKDIQNTSPAQEYKQTSISQGVNRILLGLVKKLILADRLSLIVNNLFESDVSYQSAFSLSVASILFTAQMYLDFSAYSDIAIGTAKLFGIDLKENFNLPFRSRSVTEYWRKTHISLIQWLTQTIYYPIVYRLRKHTYTSVLLAIFITFLISGFWHGNHAGYIIWGAVNGLYLMIEYLRKKKFNYSIPTPIGITFTFLLVSFSNFFFRAKSWNNITSLFGNIQANTFTPSNWMTEFIAIMGNGGHFVQQYNLMETAALVLFFFIFERKIETKMKSPQFSYVYTTLSILLILFFGNFNAGDEFIYVQF